VFCPACARLFDAPAPGPGAPSAQVDGLPLIVAGPYEPPLSTAIGRFKFQGRADLAAQLVSLLSPRVSPLDLAPTDAWVPVPLHRERLVERGYNQAALVARRLARETGASFAPRVLERRRATEQQALLGRGARMANVQGAFVVTRPWTGGRVVLVDDVVTTGATLAACVSALRARGAEVVGAVALARAAG